MTMYASFHPDGQTYVRAHTYGTDDPPILALDNPGGSLSVAVFSSTPVAEHRAFVAALLAAVAEYATAVDAWADARAVSLTKAA
ncbi:hypothetical protein AB0M28_38105 [Streptomyces sp. NPDC051940]|uniref:hypothetical protein n=1 Tax=Streptomyces sp. NPDC051940 TaxID=3155675 RepID=UPI00342DD377